MCPCCLSCCESVSCCDLIQDPALDSPGDADAHDAPEGHHGSPLQHSQADEIAFSRSQRRESLAGKPTSHDSEARIAMVRNLTPAHGPEA